MQPYEKEMMYEIYKPLVDDGRILAGVPGNHCERSVRRNQPNV